MQKIILILSLILLIFCASCTAISEQSGTDIMTIKIITLQNNLLSYWSYIDVNGHRFYSSIICYPEQNSIRFGTMTGEQSLLKYRELLGAGWSKISWEQIPSEIQSIIMSNIPPALLLDLPVIVLPLDIMILSTPTPTIS